MLITRKVAHNKVISELQDSMNFWNLQIWSKNSDFDGENSTLNIAHTSILPRTGIIFLVLVVFHIPTEKDFRMKYSDSNYGKRHKKSQNLKVVLLLSRTLYSSLTPYLLFHTHYILRYSTSMISPDPNSESHWVDIIDVRYLRK